MAISCSINPNVDSTDVSEIQENVCHTTGDEFPEDGRYYCWLHYPSDKKDLQAFQNVVADRIGKLRLGEIERDKAGESRDGGESLDLRYVWFPDHSNFFQGSTFWFSLNLKGATFSNGIDLSDSTFKGEVDVSSSTVKGPASFRKTTFEYVCHMPRTIWHSTAIFRSAKFLAPAYFAGCTFHEIADFESSVFFSGSYFAGARFEKTGFFNFALWKDNDSLPAPTAEFRDANFQAMANFTYASFLVRTTFENAVFVGNGVFERAKFYDRCSFKRAAFDSNARFDKAFFSEKTEAHFFHTRFAKDAIFEDAHLRGGASFNSAVFGSESDIIFRRGYIGKEVSFRYASAEGLLRFIEVDNSDCRLIKFQEMAHEKATRVSFDSMKLSPSWFINSDPRKFVFRNITWPLKNKNFLETELATIVGMRVKEEKSYELLITSLRNLAANAEDANRLDRASTFRRLAFECETRERKQKRKVWFNEVKAMLRRPVGCTNVFQHASEALKKLRFIPRPIPIDPVHSVYRIASSFGENASRAALVLGLIWFSFALLYYVLRDLVNPDWSFSNAMAFSTSAMLFQKPDVPTGSRVIYTLRTIQMIAAPIQAAILALAIRRKFMR